MIPIDLTLSTERVLLKPMEESDHDALLEIAGDQEIWQYYSVNLSEPGQLRIFMENAFEERKRGLRRPFTIIEMNTGAIAGTMSLGNISIPDRRLEIGWSWLGKDFRGTGINRHSKFSLMRYAFEELKFERVEFKTDVLNARARKGLENIGGKAEGVLRSHMQMWNNRRRDSIYYSVLSAEWPEIKASLFNDIAL